MSDPKIISPLLDGFKLGASISEHNGIVCYPAIKENSNKKYIVKVISVPATQAQLDALLLAGAYKDPADAMEYFHRKGEEILAEAQHLKVLSKLEGFLPFEGWQMEPITRHRLGYEIYLVGTYKRSLAKYMAKTALTHLEAINLALDLCSALSVCRQSGYIYVDLKPTNIYVSDKKEYRIGDLGFLSLDSLRYASLPEQFHSPYTPPELLDPMSAMNLSADTYAVGMILYQLYNDGHLPSKKAAPDQPVSSPIHADYELAEIIMKAISANPEERWLDPKDLGKAIAGYMQRNSVNNIPITPFIPLDVEPEEISPAEEKKSRREATKEEPATEVLPVSEPVTEIPVSESVEISKPEETTEIPAEQASEIPEISVTPEVEAVAEAAEEAETVPDIPDVEDNVPVEVQEELPEVSQEEIPEEAPEEVPEEVPGSAFAENPQAVPQDEPVSSSTEMDPDVRSLSEDVFKIIVKADDLIAHEIPQDVLYPTEPEIDPFAFARDDTEDLDTGMEQYPLMDEEVSEEETKKKKPIKHYADKSRGRKFRKFLGGLFGIAFTASVCVGGYWYYQNVYLQSVDSMSITGTQDQITVLIDTIADEADLVIHCTDSNGSRITESVNGGKVTFSNLKPSTEYTITAEVSGFHKLSGKTTDVFKTDASTRILTFEAIAGPEAGSVILDFTVEGSEPDFWNIRYSAEGENEKRETVTGHTASITGLTVGKAYTFTIDGGEDFELSGNKQMQFVASKLILAEDISMLTTDGSEILVRWKAPGDAVVENWTVRCYDGYGYDETFTVTDPEITLRDLAPNVGYNVEITASGMTAPAKIGITANTVKVTAFQAEENQNTKLKAKWEYEGEAPEEGWLLKYTIDGSGTRTVECKKAEAVIEPLIPGATYHFRVETASGSTVFNNTYTHSTAAAKTFADNGMKPENLTFGLLKTPAEENWTYENLQDTSFTNNFVAGDSASVVISSTSTFYMAAFETKVLYVIRNSYGNVLTELVTEETHSWKTMWQDGDPNIGELKVPALPSAPGDYVLQLYFNGKTVAELNFQVTQ